MRCGVCDWGYPHGDTGREEVWNVEQSEGGPGREIKKKLNKKKEYKKTKQKNKKTKKKKKKKNSGLFTNSWNSNLFPNCI